MLAAGVAFPDRTLLDPSGGSHRLSEAWSGGPALLVVGHADCGTTLLTLPYLERLHVRRGRGVAVILQDGPAIARALATEQALSLPIRLDPDPYPLSAELGLETVPTHYLVEGDGLVIRTTQGFSREDLEAFARALGASAPLFASDEEGPRYRPG